MSLHTSDMRDFVRGYEHALEAVRSHPQQALSDGLGNRILRSFASSNGARHTTMWFKEGAAMALEACERVHMEWGSE